MQKSLTTAVLIGALFAIRMPCGAATPSLTTLYSFPGPNGAFPEAGLVLHNGVLVGTTYAGGSGWGTGFKLSQSGGDCRCTVCRRAGWWTRGNRRDLHPSLRWM